jgi:hypothetical protein
LVHKDLKVLKEIRVQLALVDRQVHKVLKDLQGQQALQALLVPLDLLAQQDHKDRLVHKDLKVLKEIRVQRVHRVCKDRLVLQDPLVLQAQLVFRV